MRRVFGCLLLLLAATAPAAAVEPLWGEMPLTLGKGTFHPTWKSRFFDAGDSDRMKMWQHELMLEYAPSASLNVRLDVPYMNSRLQHTVGGRRGSTSVSGLSDITLRAKQRIHGSREDGRQTQGSVFYGIKLPTGSDSHQFPGAHNHGGGSPRLDPIDQPGTGNPGILAGYGWTRESLGEALWASATWKRDVGGGFRLGDVVDLNGTYARWVRRPNEAEQLGVKLSGGLNGQYHSSDTGDRGASAGNEFGYLGLHLTPVVTQGNYIFQAGVFVPMLRTGAQHRVDYPYEIRFGIETFF